MLPHSTGVLLMKAVLLSFIASAVAALQKCVDAVARCITSKRMRAALASVVIFVVAAVAFALLYGGESNSVGPTSIAQAAISSDSPDVAKTDPDSVNLSEAQLSAVKVEPIATRGLSFLSCRAKPK